MRLDLVLENADVVTMDPRRPRARRIGVWNGHVAGLDDELDGLAADETLDLAGATVVPGLIDAHTHLELTGHNLAAVDISAAGSPEAALALIRSAASATPENAWIEVAGYDQRVLGRHLERTDLDAAAPGRRVWVRHVSSHQSVVSSAVLGRAEGNGHLFEEAQRLVRDQRLPMPLDDLKSMVRTAADAAAAQGVTMCVDAGIGNGIGGLTPAGASAYLELFADGFPVRMQLMPASTNLHDIGAEDFRRALDLGLRTGFGSPRLSLGAQKVVLDGGMMVRTARMSEPYQDGGTGVWRDDPEQMRAWIVDGVRAGWQLAVHAIGDVAMDLALDCFAEAAAVAPRTPQRHRIEHGGLIRPDQVARVAALGLTVVGQAGFLYHFGDDFLDQLGPERAEWLYRGRSLLDAGVPVVGSTDRPLAGTPLEAIQTAVTRRTEHGTPIGAGEAITALEALAGWTVAAARSTGSEQHLGRIAPRYLADFTVLEHNPLAVPAAEIAAIGVLGTFVDGVPSEQKEALR